MDKRLAILRFIAQYRDQHGWSPSLKEIMAAVGITSTSHIHYYIEHLVNERLLYKRPYAARAIRLTKAGRAYIGEPVQAKEA